MRALLLPLLLAACAEFPALDARIPAADRRAPPPALLPLGTVLAVTDALPASPAFEADLRADAASLASRAAALPGAAADPALAARAADLAQRGETLAAEPAAGDADRLQSLQARAEALRTQGLSDEERARLTP